MMAEAYAKAKGGIGSSMCVTAGPGATNAMPDLQKHM